MNHAVYRKQANTLEHRRLEPGINYSHSSSFSFSAALPPFSFSLPFPDRLGVGAGGGAAELKNQILFKTYRSGEYEGAN